MAANRAWAPEVSLDGAELARPVAAAAASGAFSIGTAPSRRRRRAPWLAIALSGCVIVAITLARDPDGPTASGPPSPTPSYAAFVENARLHPLFSFAPPEGVQGAARYIARIRKTTGERKDTLILGDPEARDFYLLVTLQSPRREREDTSLFVEIAMQAAETGMAVLRATSPLTFASAAGRTEWADFTISGPKGARSCLGFRLLGAAEAGFSGLACGRRGATLETTALGCLISRLALTTEASETAATGPKGAQPRPAACRLAGV